MKLNAGNHGMEINVLLNIKDETNPYKVSLGKWYSVSK
jgi:hypothetical protein